MYKFTTIFFAFLSLSTINKIYAQEEKGSKKHYELVLYDSLLEAEKKDSAYFRAFSSYNQHKTNNSELNHPESDERFLSIKSLPDSTENLLHNKISRLIQFSKESDEGLELEALYEAFILSFWRKPQNYSRAFSIAISLEEKLSDAKHPPLLLRKQIYFKLGEAYYLFNDFDKSIALLSNISGEMSLSFEDTTSFEAIRIKGICFANINQMDSSDYYFMSTLKSDEIILNRPAYNAVAVSNLACNYMIKKEYETAIDLFNEVLPILKKVSDPGHIAGMYAGLGYSFYNKRDFKKLGTIVDSLLLYANNDDYNQIKRLKQAYTLAGKFYTNVGDPVKGDLYNDSLSFIYAKESSLFTSSYITYAIQSSQDEKLKLQQAKIEDQYYTLCVITIISIITLIALGFIIYLYQRNRKAYRLLVSRTRDWALFSSMSAKVIYQGIDKTSKQTEEDRVIMKKVVQYVIDEKHYKDPELSLTLLTKELSINRSYVSKAINSITGSTFSEWLNEYRIKEAIRILSASPTPTHSIDEILYEAGYISRSSFYRSFKKITGLSPLMYIKQLKSQANESALTD